MRLVLRVDPDHAVVSDETDIWSERAHRRHRALPSQGSPGLDQTGLSEAELWSECVREAANPGLPHVCHFEVPGEPIKRPRATESPFVSHPAHRLVRICDIRLERPRACGRWATTRSIADVVLKR